MITYLRSEHSYRDIDDDYDDLVNVQLNADNSSTNKKKVYDY